MKKLMAATAAFLMSATLQADPFLCTDTADNCAIPGFDAADMDRIFLDVAGNDVTTIIGSPQTEPNSLLYDIVFTSNELLDHGSGFAIITADDGWINHLSFNVDDILLPEGSTGMEVAEFSLNGRNNTSDALVEISFVRSDGTIGTFGDQSLYEGGENEFTVWSNSELERITLSSDAGFEVASFKHLRVDIDTVGNPDPVDVTGPDTAALLAMGLIGLFSARMRKS